MKYLLLLILPFCLLSACKESTSSEANNSSKTEDEVVPNPNFVLHELPAMPLDFYNELKEKCDAVDYIFHNLPFSINQTDRPSVLSNLAFISEQQGYAIPDGCNILGREFFQVNGEILLEADFYFCPPYHFTYVFLQNKKPIYANRMSESGVKFYANLINQIKVNPKS